MTISKFKIISISFLLYVFGSQTAFPQNYNFKNYTTSDGLPQSQIMSLYQDYEGYFWIGTFEGLTRYNGHSFYTFGKNHGLTNTTVRQIIEADSVSLLIGTWGNGIYRATRIPNNRDSLSFTNLTDSLLPNLRIHRMIINPADKKIIVSSLNMIYFFDGKKTPHSFASTGVVRDVIIRKNSLWISHSKGLTELDLTTLSVRKTIAAFNEKDVRQIIFRNDESLWVLTDQSVVSYDLVVQKVMFEIDKIQHRELRELRNFVVTPEEHLWVTSYQTGLFKIIPGNKLSVTHISTKNGLLGNRIYSLAVDHDQQLWLGTISGISKLQNEPFITFNNKIGLASNYVFTVNQDKSGNVILGLENSGLTEIDLANHSAPIVPSEENKTENFQIYTLAHDRDGTIYAGTGSGLRYLVRKRWFEYVPFPGKTDENIIFSILPVSDDTLLLGSAHSGIYVVNLLNAKHPIRVLNEKNGLSHPNINSMIRDSKGRFWIGTGSGITVLDPKLNVLRKISVKDGLPDETVNHLFLSDNQMLWISTVNGLASINLKNDDRTVIPFELNSELPNKYIAFVSDDKKAGIWIGTGLGLVRYHHESNRIIGKYNSRNSNIGDEFVKGSVYSDSENNIWFGSSNGVTVFLTNQETERKEYYPKIFIEKIENQNQKMIPGFPHIGYENKNLTITFSSPVYRFEGDHLYAYRLEGLTDSWTHFHKLNEANFTNLEPGKYSLHIKMITGDLRTSELSPELVFYIVPPFYMTMWFKLIALLGLAFGVYGYFVYRTKKLTAINAQLEGKILDRTKELMYEKDLVVRHSAELEKLNQELKILNERKDEFIGMAAHDLRNPLNIILLKSEMLAGHPGLKSDETLVKDVSTVKNLAERMKNLIDSLLSKSVIDSGKVQLNFKTEDLNAIAEESVRFFEPLSASKGISLILKTAPLKLNILCDRQRLMEILDNLISNAIKYSFSGSEIIIYTKRTEIEAIIMISDHGQGFSTDDMQHIFQSYTPLSSKPTSGENSIGLGLAIVKQLVDLHDAVIEVKSVKGKGTDFIVSFKLEM